LTTLTKKQTHTFISRQPNYQLWIEQPLALRDDAGRKYDQTPFKAVAFENNRYVADEEKAEKVGMTFDQLVEWIQNHEAMGTEVWDEGAPPSELSPTIKEQSERIFAAVAKFDPDALAKLMQEERATHDRQAVIQVATAALEQLQSEGEPEKD